MGIRIKSKDKVIFFGDSITEANPGYVSFIAEMLEALYPELGVQVINRGVSGNQVTQLLERVEKDVIAEDAQWVSIAIGINDCWHGLDGKGLGLAVSDYEDRLGILVDILRDRTKAEVLICTPSVIGEDPLCDSNQALEQYVEAALRVAKAKSVPVVPIHEAFVQALNRARPTTDKALFTTDGVHMNPAGNALFGMTWLKSLGAFEDLVA